MTDDHMFTLTQLDRDAIFHMPFGLPLEPRIAIYSHEATDAQVSWGYCQDPRGVLKLGMTYQVERVEKHGWHTKLFLIGVESGRGFNSVSFDWGTSDQVARACIICNLPWPCPSRPDVKDGEHE